jgi:hypothetical protein
MSTPPSDVKAAESQLMRFSSVDGVTGREAGMPQSFPMRAAEGFGAHLCYPLQRRKQTHQAADRDR